MGCAAANSLDMGTNEDDGGGSLSTDDNRVGGSTDDEGDGTDVDGGGTDVDGGGIDEDDGVKTLLPDVPDMGRSCSKWEIHRKPLLRKGFNGCRSCKKTSFILASILVDTVTSIVVLHIPCSQYICPRPLLTPHRKYLLHSLCSMDNSCQISFAIAGSGDMKLLTMARCISHGDTELRFHNLKWKITHRRVFCFTTFHGLC